MTNFTKNLTEGNVGRQLLRFAVPFFVANFLQSLYGVVDMIVVGQFVDTAESSAGTAALNVSSTVMMFVNSVIIGFVVGGTVLIAQCVGAGNVKRLKNIIGSLFTSFTILAVVLSVLLYFFGGSLLTLLGTDAEAYDGALAYLKINALGFIFTVGYNSVSAVLRGMGDSVRPMIFVSIATVVNIGLDLYFVAVLGMGVDGAAYATIIAQGLSFVMAVVYLKRNNFVFDFKLASFRIDSAELRKLLKIGFPNAVQQALVQGSFLAILPLTSSFGTSALSVSGIMGKINGFALLPSIAMMTAVSSMVGQNYGAGKIDRVKKTVFAGMKVIFPISLVMWLAVFIFPEQILRLFTSTPEVLDIGVNYLRIGCTEYIVCSQMFVINGLIIGTGNTMVTLLNSFISSLFLRLPLAYIFANLFNMGVYGVSLATIIAPFGGLAIALIFLFCGKWKKNKPDFASDENNA